LVTGNPGKRALPPNEAKLDLAEPTPPSFLCDEAKVEWGRICNTLYRAGLMTEVDRAALAAYCQSYGMWERAERALERMASKDQINHALMVKTTNGNAIQNPLHGIANKAKADMVRYAAEFGMTPSARVRVDAIPQDGKKDTISKYFAA